MPLQNQTIFTTNNNNDFVIQGQVFVSTNHLQNYFCDGPSNSEKLVRRGWPPYRLDINWIIIIIK